MILSKQNNIYVFHRDEGSSTFLLPYLLIWSGSVRFICLFICVYTVRSWEMFASVGHLGGDPAREFLSSCGMTSATWRTWSAPPRPSPPPARETPISVQRLCTLPSGLSFPEPPVAVSSPVLDWLGRTGEKMVPSLPQDNAALCWRQRSSAVAAMTAAFSPRLELCSDHIHVPLRLGGLDNRQL